MLVFFITIAITLALNFLLINGYQSLINEAADLGSVTAKTVNDYPMVLTALSVIFPVISIAVLVLFILYIRKWVPYKKSSKVE